jgi:iron complex outermembrane receptor protein
MRALLVNVGLSALAASQSALAQVAPATAPPDPAAAIAADGIDDIIVTANRRSESAQSTALAITAVGGEDLTQRGVVQPEDLNKAVAGLGLSANGAITQVYLRGVGTFAGLVGDSSVLVSIDGVALGSPTMVGGQFFDLERVEVLKGPQGTLYGRNAAAGAINIISAKPRFDKVSASGSIEAGNYDYYRASTGLNVPLTDTLAIRAAAQVIRRNGYFSDGSGDDNQESFRLQALFEPVDAVSLLLGADYANVHGRGSPYVATPFADSNDPYEGPSTTTGNRFLLEARETGAGPYGPGTQFQLVENDSRANSENWGVRAELNVDLGFGTLTVLPAYREVAADQIYNPGFRLTGDVTGKQTTGEVRLASEPGSKLSWLIGGYFYDDEQIELNTVEQGVGVFESSFGSVRETRALAAFGEATYSIADAIRVTGGLRYTDEERSIVGSTTSINYNPPTFDQPVTVPLSGDVSYGRLTYKAGVEADVGERSLVYATVSTGFRAGGLNQDTAPNSYRPEKLTAYSIGSKNRFLDNRLQLNVEGFYWNYIDHQENNLLPLNSGGFSVITQNIGKSSVKGVSADILFRPTPADTFSAQIEYLDATFDSYVYDVANNVAPTEGTRTGCTVTQLSPNGPPTTPGGLPTFGTSRVDCSGKPFTRAPEFSVNTSYQHRFELGGDRAIVAGADAQISSSYFFTTDYIEAAKQPAFAIVNLDLSYRAPGDRWAVTGYVRNVTDEVVRNSGSQHSFIPGLIYATLRPPRTYGVRLDFNF